MKMKKSTIIAIVAVVLVVIIGFGVGSTAPTNQVIVDNNTGNQITTTQTVTNQKKTEYSVGEVFQDKTVKISYQNVEDFAGSTYHKPKAGYKFVKADFEFENIGTSDYSIWSFKCYADGYDMEQEYFSEVSDSLTLVSLSPSRKAKGSVFFSVPENASNIVIEYSTLSWTDNTITFKVK